MHRRFRFRFVGPAALLGSMLLAVGLLAACSSTPTWRVFAEGQGTFYWNDTAYAATGLNRTRIGTMQEEDVAYIHFGDSANGYTLSCLANPPISGMELVLLVNSQQDTLNYEIRYLRTDPDDTLNITFFELVR